MEKVRGQGVLEKEGGWGVREVNHILQLYNRIRAGIISGHRRRLKSEEITGGKKPKSRKVFEIELEHRRTPVVLIQIKFKTQITLSSVLLTTCSLPENHTSTLPWQDNICRTKIHLVESRLIITFAKGGGSHGPIGIHYP